jgi:hypothetical protein
MSDARQNYDLVDAADGRVVASVRYLWPEEPVDCCICGKPTFDHFGVPYYCGPVRSGKSEGGYRAACERCYGRWSAWDDALTEYDSWVAALSSGSGEQEERK